MSFNRLFDALKQQQNGTAPLPALGTLQKTTPAAPAPFQASNLPWQQQFANAIDWNKSSGDAFNAIGREGVINYMGDGLMKKYGTNNLSNFRWLENKDVPGGYELDWMGRQKPNSFLSGVKDLSRSKGITSVQGAGDSIEGNPITVGNAAEDGVSFGATWEGEGGTTFRFVRDPSKPNGIGVVANAAQTNDTGDILTAAAILAGGVMAGGGLGAVGTSTGAGASAAGGTAATMGAAGSQGVLPASYFAGTGAAGAGTAAMAGGAAANSELSNPFLEQPWSATPNSTPLDFSSTATMGSGSTTPAFNPAVDSQAANVAIEAGGGNALSGYTAPSAGTAGVSSLAGGGGAGTPPPANPYNIGSYTNPTNLANLAKSAMGEFSWTSLIGPALNLGGQLYAGKQASDAAEQQAAAAREAAAMFKPWIDNGAWGIGQAGTLLGRNGPEAAKAAFQMDPGYQFRLDQGSRALERAAAARGMLGSGKYLKDAMAYNQGQASQEFGSSLNRLLAVAGMGQTATNSGAGYNTDAATVSSAGRIARANALSDGITQGISMYGDNQLMNRLFPTRR